MVTLKKVDESNYRAVLALTTDDSQSDFVASNAISLAQAWVFYDKARPFAIVNEETIVGFIMFDYLKEAREVEIWRLMIGTEFQGKGYGKQALVAAIELLKNENKFDRVQINYVKENAGAKHLYQKLGFEETGEMEGNEVVMKLTLASS
ncbi:GNAT family N-acetyltransferase [Paenisporosarcina cavernae]|uniref:GNAT family N-acetyltransferase n=1 Tax=Paenisporosarcina cavernae TaxID=2320858 RepID=A0A385YQ39_9BACL|nr:GNAT family N-acetyltransferase [Paenisporosarcina cavernae]AYC28460.1 GNAT family N-acetyltransferase [Paenisporosarcina cavernae]